MDDLANIPYYQLLLYVSSGVLLLIGFYLINNYIIPISKGSKSIFKKYWQKFQIIFWLVFLGLFFIALFRASMLITLIFTVVILGLGWDFWRNIFAGIIIKFNNQINEGDTISTSFTTGKIKTIDLSQSELINSEGELVVIPNYKLRYSVLKHLYKKTNIQTYSFVVRSLDNQNIKSIYQKALNCPYISTNQKIKVEQTEGNEFIVKASVIDAVFVNEVNQYFNL